MATKQRSGADQPGRKLKLRRPAIVGTDERTAMELALAYLTQNEIKPRLTLKEFAELYGLSLRQVQSDAERGYLPLAPRTIPGRRELLQVNMVAYYARMYLDGFNHLEKASTFA